MTADEAKSLATPSSELSAVVGTAAMPSTQQRGERRNGHPDFQPCQVA